MGDSSRTEKEVVVEAGTGEVEGVMVHWCCWGPSVVPVGETPLVLTSVVTEGVPLRPFYRNRLLNLPIF